MKKRKDGRYQASITLTNPLTNEKKRVYAYGYTPEEVKRELNRLKENNGRSMIAPTFGEWKDEWLRIKEDEIERSTLSSYKDCLRLHISPTLDRYRLHEITASLIRLVLNKIERQRTKEYAYVLINSILQQALKEDLIKRNPCINLRKPKVKTQETIIMTDDEYNAIIEAAKNTPYEPLLILAYDTGMRRSEIAALKWKDIDFKHELIHIERAIKTDRSASQDKRFSIGTPKTDYGIRNVALTIAIASALKKHFGNQKELFKNRNRILTLNDYVFTSRSYERFGEFIQPDSISHEFLKIKLRAGVKRNITFKSFRHTCLTALAEANIAPKAIQAHAGHANAAFTLNRYVHKTVKMEQSIANFFNNREKK